MMALFLRLERLCLLDSNNLNLAFVDAIKGAMSSQFSQEIKEKVRIARQKARANATIPVTDIQDADGDGDTNMLIASDPVSGFFYSCF